MTKVTDPRLVEGVQLTRNQLGNGAYGSGEEVEIPGARVAAKKLHTQLNNLGSPEQVIEDLINPSNNLFTFFLRFTNG